jgi:hypothetical protein
MLIVEDDAEEDLDGTEMDLDATDHETEYVGLLPNSEPSLVNQGYRRLKSGRVS